jgi:septum formation protein
MNEKITRQRLILASQSPRRQELLKGLGLEFSVSSLDVSEDFPNDMPLADVAIYLAEKKAAAFERELTIGEILITSDTTVVHAGKILNKPQSHHEAILMLEQLSGSAHEVITGVCMKDQKKQISFQDRTKVYFRSLDQAEIQYYVDRFKPLDKAGAYGIQEWIGYIGVYKLEGSFYTVMGLPVHLIYDALKNW